MDIEEEERLAMQKAQEMAKTEALEAHKAASENDWEIPINALMFDEKIGGGYFGEVFKGRFWGTDVAIKKIMQDLDKDDQILGDLRKEAAILSALRHPNVVLFMGICSSPDVCIVTEFCPRGSLFDLLHDAESTVNFEKMMKIALGIARGMTYLHNLKRKIIHRDLKSHNVLVGQDWSPKICDFGISHVRKKWRDGATMPGAKHYGVLGTPEWMAPEVLQGLAYDESADVYSYGIVLTELLTRQMPFRDKYQIFDYMDVVSCVLDDNAVPTIPEWASFETRYLIESCVDRDVRKRPSFTKIIETLNTIQSQYAHEEIVKNFDVPRLKNMLYSSRTFCNMLAAREVGEMQGTHDSSLIDDLYLFDFARRLTELLGYWNPQLQLVVCEALIRILSHSQDTDQLLEIVVDGSGHEELNQVIETYTGSGEEEELLGKCKELLHLLQNKLESRTETESMIDVDEERCSECEAVREIINGKPAKFCPTCGKEYNMETDKNEVAESIRTLFEHLNIDKEYAENFIAEGLGPADIPYLHFGDLCRLIPNVRQRTKINACSKQMLEKAQESNRTKKKKKKKKKKKRDKDKKKERESNDHDDLSQSDSIALGDKSGHVKWKDDEDMASYTSTTVKESKKTGRFSKIKNKLVRGASTDDLNKLDSLSVHEEWAMRQKGRRRGLSPGGGRSRSKSSPHGSPSDNSVRDESLPRKRSGTAADVDYEDSKQSYGSAWDDRELSSSLSSRKSGMGGGVQFLRNHHVSNTNSRMVLSIEDHPEYNSELVRLAKEQNVVIVTVKTTDAAVEFFRTNIDSTLDPTRFRVMTCMTRESEKRWSRKRAGADVIKKFRRMGYPGPILVYSTSIRKTKEKLQKYNLSPLTDQIVLAETFQKALNFCTFTDPPVDEIDLEQQMEYDIASSLHRTL